MQGHPGVPLTYSAYKIMNHALGLNEPEVLIAGDDGRGAGSHLIYRYLRDNAENYAGFGITFHYFFPDVDWHNRVLMALNEVNPRPLLCADAGYMYVAKMSGYAASYDLFFPDAGELAFLADENAPHPFYTRGFLLAEEDKALEHAMRAYAYENAALNLLVKGRVDCVMRQGKALDVVENPQVPCLEAIGGTGDTLTGITSALIALGMPIPDACKRAALTNRIMGQLAAPTPATSTAEILPFLVNAWEIVRFDDRRSL